MVAESPGRSARRRRSQALRTTWWRPCGPSVHRPEPSDGDGAANDREGDIIGGSYDAGREDEDVSLQGRVASGLTWTVLHTWGGQLLQLAVFVVLARLLLPVDFGLVALAAVFVSFAQLVVDQGLGDALIQRRDLTRSHIDTAFWVTLLTGVLLTVAGMVVAHPIALLLGDPKLGPILQVLSLTFTLSALSSIQVALLRRALDFRALAIRVLVAIAGGGAVGIALAAIGAGPWALVGQQLASAVLSVVVLWRFTAWRPRLEASGRHFRELFGFGAHVVGSDLLNFLSRNVDNLLIGVVLGPAPLGIYAVGYRILDVSQRLLVNVARKVTFPAFSRLQHDRDRMRRAYLRVGRTAGVVILPGYLWLAVAAPEITTVLFGQRWEMSGQVAAILFLIGPVLSLQAFSDSLLNAAGHPEVVFRFRLFTAVVNVIGFLVAVSFGILAVAFAYVLRGYLLLPVILWLTRVHAGIPVRSYLSQFFGIGAATALMVAALLAIKVGPARALPPGPMLLIEIVVGAGAYIIALRLLEPAVLTDVLGVARQALRLGSGKGQARSQNRRRLEP